MKKTMRSPTKGPASRAHCGGARRGAVTRGSLLLLAASVSCAMSPRAQSVWLKRNPSAPPALGNSFWGHTLSYESSTAKLVLFGGVSPTGPPWNQTLEWTGNDWRSPSPAVSPPARSWHAATGLFPQTGVMVHAGQLANLVLAADTWVWDGASWTRVSTGGPSPRRLHALAYDISRRRVVLFGGDGSTSSATPLADTWEWDGVSWTLMPTSVAPSARFGHFLGYDLLSARVVLFGGTSVPSGSAFGDTWEWDGVRWTQRSPKVSPPARAFAAGAFNLSRLRLTMHGGAAPIQSVTDAWEWDALANQWNPVAMAGGIPVGRQLHGVGYEPAGRCVVVGGWGWTSSIPNETWELIPLSSTGVASSYGGGCPGTNGVPVLTAPLPPKLATPAFTLDISGARASSPAAVLLGPIAAAALPGGCTLLVGSPVGLILQTGGAGTASLPLPIPSSISLLYQDVCGQAVIADPLGALSGVACMSAGLRLVLGQ
jgi:hypothetical protein